MKRRRRYGSLVILGGIVVLVMATAAPASAEVIQGPCVGFAEFSNGARVTESTPLDEVVEVPEEDTVVYYGNTTLTPPEEEEAFSGYVSVRLPLGGSWVVVDWPSPPGETLEVDDGGTYKYEVPPIVPRGTGGLEVTAFHTQRGQTCQVAVSMALAGDPGPAAIIGAAGTLVFGAGVLAAGRKKVV